jgi:hypothetical protein
MKIHSDWTKPIEFKLDNCLYIAYGWPRWPSRCEWIVPGTIED